MVTKPAKKSKKKKARAVVADLTDEAQHLYEALRSLRATLAQDKGVPPYVVFGDRTLRELAVERPETDKAFLAIHGVGESKLSTYGDVFIDAIKSFRA
jgi:ATP-dependent DNA helicase RecQ